MKVTFALIVPAAVAAVVAGVAATAAQRGANPAPAAAATAFADLAKLPDWSGVWVPDVSDQGQQVRRNPTPWNPEAAAKVAAMTKDEQTGNPAGIYNNCLPEGMPTWMLISHNALEFLFTPGRVTLLGESDGNRLRRIYTDGRKHSDDPDLTFHGESIGHWEGDALVVDTIGVLPEVYLATGEAVGVPNGGDMHIVERMHLRDKDTLLDDLEIVAPRVLTGPWKTTRIYYRKVGRENDIIEGVCLQGSFVDQTDEHGNAIFVPKRPK